MTTAEKRHKNSGLSLIETVVATFLLGSAIVLIVTLFHRSLQLGAHNERVSRAVGVARSVLSEIKADAASVTSYSAGLPVWKNRSYSPPDNPDYSVQTRVGQLQPLFSPCDGLANRFANPHIMEDVSLPVKVTVSWGPGRNNSISLVDRVREPRREIDRIRVSRVDTAGSPVGFSQIMEFRAEALDSAGQVIPGIGFAWNVEPITGNATLLERNTSDAAFCRIQHKYYFNPLTSTWESVPGLIKAKARAVYHGQLYIGESTEIDLQ